MVKRKPYAGIRAPTVAAVVAALGEPAADWKGRCHEVACRLLELKLVSGVERYGHYYGPVRAGYFTPGRPFYRHGWIEAAPGVVVDPTRWVFEARRPYIHVGPDDDYDPGGNRLAASMVGPYPSNRLLGDANDRFDPRAFEDSEAGLVTDLGLDGEALLWVAHLTNGQASAFTFGQLMWLANLPLPWHGPHARAIYEAFERAGQEALIPIDNWRTALGRPMAENRDGRADQEAAAAEVAGHPRRRPGRAGGRRRG
jgi:hypothetical protein